ncbi:cytochrome c biogenesis protein CcsA [Actinopolymorpha singaporensis]|uniref:Heme exporter protein C n=1 Tax=Actinopolymorpha singaporensis TaxID=117157 RepID=A0A1H1TK41_9ACTN|nr:cytochrome c biogenesis protein CcsA [Actinopolymorpha singaporensis]SDS60623.1 heme exporter protein C [Actinopolymorpha singaporensis]
MERSHDTPRPVRAHRRTRLGAVAVTTAVAATVLSLVAAPPDAIQGQAQRLMYVHVPAAWTAFLMFFVVAAASAMVLTRGGRRWDALARACAELGVGMTALAIAEGSMWGHSAWGTWWTWDPRLVTTALMLVLYAGYLAVRGLPGEPVRRARRSAVLGLAAFAVVPLVHFSVLWFRTIHQPPTLLRPEVSAPPIEPLMLAALLTSVLAFTTTALWFVRRRVPALVEGPAEMPAAPVAERGRDAAPPAPAAPAAVSPAADVVPAAPVPAGAGEPT